MKRLAPLLVACVVAACGRSPEPRLWTLDAVAPVAPRTTATTPLRVDAVHLPLALDRPELVERRGANRVTVHDFDRWSAPLGDLVRRTLTQDLMARLPAGSVIFPDAPKTAATRSLVVDVLDWRPAVGGWVLDAG